MHKQWFALFFHFRGQFRVSFGVSVTDKFALSKVDESGRLVRSVVH